MELPGFPTDKLYKFSTVAGMIGLFASITCLFNQYYNIVQKSFDIQKEKEKINLDSKILKRTDSEIHQKFKFYEENNQKLKKIENPSESIRTEIRKIAAEIVDSLKVQSLKLDEHEKKKIELSTQENKLKNEINMFEKMKVILFLSIFVSLAAMILGLWTWHENESAQKI